VIEMVFGRGEKKDVPAVRDEGRRGITARSPFDLWTEMDRMFDQFRSSFDDLFWPFAPRGALRTYTGRRAPPMDVVDLGDRYEMKAEVPGIPKEKIDIQVTPYGVEISAEHEETKEEKGKNYLHRERSSAGIYKSVEFPEEVKTDSVDAKLKDGVLTISLPKVEPKPELTARKVEIK
jgi:HSP20 family protein